MKKILVILVLSLSSLCFTAEGFKDLKWGASKEEVIQIRTMYNNCNICVSDAYELFKDKITKRGFQAIWLGQNHKTIMPEVFTEENKKKHNYLEY